MRICIWRMGFAGDVLFSTAALAGIKRKYPRSHITYGVWKQYANLILLDPNIDDFVHDDGIERRKVGEEPLHPDRQRKFPIYREVIRKDGLEYAKRRADRTWEISHEKYYMPPGEMIYWGEIHARQAAELDLLRLEDMESFKPRIYLSSDDIIPRPEGMKIAALGVFSKNGADARLWGVTRSADSSLGVPKGELMLNHCWTELVKGLKKMGFTCVQLGGEEDPRVRGAVDLCGKLTWRQSVAIVMQADVCVTIDSFLLHAAVAEKRATDGSVLSDGTPTVAILGPTDGRAMFPADAESAVEVQARQFPECPCYHSSRFGKGECPNGNACMKSISVEQILEGVEKASDGT